MFWCFFSSSKENSIFRHAMINNDHHPPTQTTTPWTRVTALNDTDDIGELDSPRRPRLTSSKSIRNLPVSIGNYINNFEKANAVVPPPPPAPPIHARGQRPFVPLAPPPPPPPPPPGHNKLIKGNDNKNVKNIFFIIMENWIDIFQFGIRHCVINLTMSWILTFTYGKRFKRTLISSSSSVQYNFKPVYMIFLFLPFFNSLYSNKNNLFQRHYISTTKSGRNRILCSTHFYYAI